MTDRDRQIRDLAYLIWEEAGRPTGQDDRHWREAEHRYAAEQTGGGTPAAGLAKPKGGKASKGAAAGAAKEAKGKGKKVAVATTKPASKATTAPPPSVAAAPKTTRAPKSKSKEGRSAKPAPASKTKPVKTKGRGGEANG